MAVRGCGSTPIFAISAWVAVRGISVQEASELTGNRYAILRNTGRRHRSRRKLDSRRVLIGHTNGGRALTLVVEETTNPTSWTVITGWNATSDERRRIPRS